MLNKLKTNIMKKLILKSDIRKMKLTEDEQYWANKLQDVEYSRTHLLYPTSQFDEINTMYLKAIKHFVKEYMNDVSEVSFNETCWYVANKFSGSPEAVASLLKGTNDFIICDRFGLDSITLK